jgi:HK97 family phage portal protein
MGSRNAKRIRAFRTSSRPEHRAFVRRTLGETIIESGDVVDLFNNPHPSMDANLFWEMVVTWACLRGEFFVLPMDSADQPVDLASRSPRIQRMITLPPELFWHMVVGYTLEGWRYTGSPLITPIPSEMLLPSEVVHARLPNPYLYWRGMSPLLVCDVAAKTDFAGEQFQKGLWINNADTGVVVTTEQVLDDTQREIIKAALRERKRKAGTPDRPLFLFGGAKIEKPTLSMMDMQFLETRKFLRQEIAAIFKVPESLMGFTDDKASALSGGGQAISAERLQFVEGPVTSHCHRIEMAINKIVVTFGDDLVGWFDIDSLPIMQEARRARLDTAVKAFGIGFPLNEVNTAYDLGFPKLPWGDKSFLPFNLQEVTADGLGANEPQPSEGGDDQDEDDDSKSDPKEDENPNSDEADKEKADKQAAKSNPFTRLSKLLTGLQPATLSTQPADHIKAATAALWRKRMQFRKAHVNLFAGKIGKVLTVFRKKTLAKLDEVHLEKSAGRIGEIKSLVDIIFDQHGFAAALSTELHQPTAALLQAAGENMLAEIGYDDPWKYPPKQVLEFIAGRTLKIQGASESVRNELNTTLAEGVEAGETHAELAARVKSKFNDLSDGKAKVIARTEVNTATCKAGYVAMKDVGIEYKSWLGSHGPHAREGHQSVEDATVDQPILVDDLFDVPTELGDVEQMMQPLDEEHGATAANIINCQCDVVAAQKTDEDEKSVTFKIYGIGKMKFLKTEQGHNTRDQSTVKLK